MMMRGGSAYYYRFFSFLLLMLFTTSFAPNPDYDSYELSLEAGGCRYQITVNEDQILDGKSYQPVNKTVNIDQYLNGHSEQYIDIKMSRISREMPLKNTGAFIKLRLDKVNKEGSTLIKEIKLPTFAYDDDEDQPHSIGGSIHFRIEVEEPTHTMEEERLHEAEDSIAVEENQID